jgi:single-strand DNA-binding protein
MNKVILIGNVGKDPDVRYYGADQAIATLRLATTEKGYTLQNGTKVPDRTDWHTLIFYRRLAKVVEQYVHKGDKIYIDGRLQYRNYDDKKGIQHIATEIIVDNLELLTPRSSSQSTQQAVSLSQTETSQTTPSQTSTQQAISSSQTMPEDSLANVDGQDYSKIIPF